MSLSSSINSSDFSNDETSSSSSSTPLCHTPPAIINNLIIEESLACMNVYITNVHGRTVLISVDEGWTVERLKKQFAKLYSTSWQSWYMMHNGKYLQNHGLLKDYKIKDGSTIYVSSRQAHQFNRPIELYVTDLTDNSIVLVIADLDWTVQKVKKEYAQQKGNEQLNCRLYSKGCLLEERRTLAEYKLHDEAVIHSVLASTPATQVGLQRLKKCILRKRSCKFL